MRAAVVGHVEWVDFARVSRLPRPGEIIHAVEAWEEPGGGGAVAAFQLAKLARGAAFFTALGDDHRGKRARAELSEGGLRVHAVARPRPQRRALTFTEPSGERTITVIGDRLVPHGEDSLPWDELAEADAVYFTGGDPAALRAARRARTLVVTPRAADAMAGAGVEVDALVLSEHDADERSAAEALEPAARLVVYTHGAEGGRYAVAGGESGTFTAAPLPGPPVDAYGCGDSFAAGLTYGLGAGWEVERALELAARCGAACRAGRGGSAAQLEQPE